MKLFALKIVLAILALPIAIIACTLIGPVVGLRKWLEGVENVFSEEMGGEAPERETGS